MLARAAATNKGVQMFCDLRHKKAASGLFRSDPYLVTVCTDATPLPPSRIAPKCTIPRDVLTENSKNDVWSFKDMTKGFAHRYEVKMRKYAPVPSGLTFHKEICAKQRADQYGLTIGTDETDDRPVLAGDEMNCDFRRRSGGGEIAGWDNKYTGFVLIRSDAAECVSGPFAEQSVGPPVKVDVLAFIRVLRISGEAGGRAAQKVPRRRICGRTRPRSRENHNGCRLCSGLGGRRRAGFAYDQGHQWLSGD